MESQEPQAKIKETVQEFKIGKTVYILTSVFEGNKDLKETIEKWVVKKVLNDIEK